MFDLVIFDCDGVLVDSEAIAGRVLGAHLKALGLDMSPARMMTEYVGLSMKSVMEKIERQLGRPLPEGWLEALQKETFEAFRRELKPVAGARELIEALQARGQKFCVASSGSPDKITLSLSLTGLYPFFAGRIFSTTEVKNGKPAPDLFLLAANSLGANPQNTLVIEDSLPGVTAAAAAGMTACGYAAHGQESALRKAGARVFYTLAEINAWLASGKI